MSDELQRLRQGVYRVLSAGFARPTNEFIGVAADSVEVLDRIGLYDYSYAPQVVDMLFEFADADQDDLARSYQILDTGDGGEVCLARESGWLGNSRTGETARLLAELRTTQESFGIAVPADRIDHASTELAAMASVCGRIAARDNGQTQLLLRRQADFARDHVLRWIPLLGRQLSEVARHVALRSLGAATVAFLEHERQHLPMLLDEMTGVRS
jgi:TorA maturation chaperone TorD